MKNIAVWGIGPHALNNVLPAIVESEGLNLHGVCTRDLSTLKKCGENYGCSLWKSEDEMLNDEQLDIVYLCTPIGLHAVQGKRILESNKHLWCEKPFTSNINDTQELINIADQRGLTVSECFMYLFHPQFKKVLEVISQNSLGKVIGANIRFGIPFLERPGFRLTPELSGGAFWDVGSYLVSAVLALFPEQEIKIDYAELSYYKNYNVDLEGRAIISFEKGQKAYIDWALGSSYRNELDLWCKKGSLFTDKVFSKKPDYNPKLILRDKNGNEKSHEIESANHFILMFKHMIETLTDKGLAKIEKQNILLRATTLQMIKEKSKETVFTGGNK